MLIGFGRSELDKLLDLYRASNLVCCLLKCTPQLASNARRIIGHVTLYAINHIKREWEAAKELQYKITLV